MNPDPETTRKAALVRQMMDDNPSLSQRNACARVGLPESTYRRRKLAQAAEGRANEESAKPTPAGINEDEDHAISGASEAAPAGPGEWKPEAVMRAHGYDPEEYLIVRTRFNRWGDPENPMQQLRFDAVPRAEILMAADMSDWDPPTFEGEQDYGDEPLPFVLRGDQHAPYHDVGLHNCALQHDRYIRPGLIVLMGDGINAERASRHRPRRGRTQATKVGIKAYGHILADTRKANPSARIVVIRGNHDDWIEQRLMETNPDLGDIETAFTDIPMHSLRHLLHLDEMGIELVDESYDRGTFSVTPNLTARHGYMTSKNTGAQMLQKISRSTAQGHSHRMAFDYVTYHDDSDHTTVTHVSVQTGTMAEIHEGLYYDDQPNWQQGYVSGWAWPEGDFSLAPNLYVHGRLLTADGRRYTPQEA